jgi:hypothetical protein
MKKPTPQPFARAAFYTTPEELEGIGPNLHFIRRDELSPTEAHYTKQKLEMLAGDAAGRDLGAAMLVTLVRELANNPEALAALNRKQETVHGDLLALNRAVHYQAFCETHPGDKKAYCQKMVSVVWGVADSQVKDDYTNHKTAAAKLVDGIVKEAMGAIFPTREAVLDVLVEDMAHRAALMIPKRRQPKSKKK